MSLLPLVFLSLPINYFFQICRILCRPPPFFNVRCKILLVWAWNAVRIGLWIAVQNNFFVRGIAASPPFWLRKRACPSLPKWPQESVLMISLIAFFYNHVWVCLGRNVVLLQKRFFFVSILFLSIITVFCSLFSPPPQTLFSFFILTCFMLSQALFLIRL